MSEIEGFEDLKVWQKSHDFVEEKEKESRDAIHDVFRDRTFHGVHQGTTWQLHRYGINCKLSGSVFAVTEIEGAIPLIHGPIGCAFHQRLTPRRIYSPISDMPCTCLDEKAVIYGGEEQLREKLVETYNRYKPELIAVLPTCVSGLTGDDIQGVIHEVKVEVPCDILYVPCEGFAHRSRQSLDVLIRDYMKGWKDPTRFPAREIRGCGHIEVMLSLVDQLMEDQDIDVDVEEHSINIETFGRFSYGFKRQLEETKKLFHSMGVKINTTLLNCSVDEIKRAPAAELNLVGRGIRWAERMKEKFGTDYIRRWFFYTGIEGTEKFLMDVASKLGLDGEAEEVIVRERNSALQELDRYGKIFKNYDFALFTHGIFFTPHSIRMYLLDFKIPVRYVCVDTRRLRDLNVSDETIETVIRNTEDLLDEWDIGVDLVLNPTLSQLGEITKKVDYVLGDRGTALLYGKEGISMVNTSIGTYSSPFGFTGKVEFAMNLLRELRRHRNQRKTFVSRFDYDETYYLMLADPMCLASMQMWSEMWSLRSDIKLRKGGEENGRR